MLTGAAAAGAGALLHPAVGRGADAHRRDRAWNRWWGRLHGESPSLAAGGRFVLAGVQWLGPAHPRIELRTRMAQGGWSPWALASLQGHEPDGAPPAPRPKFGDPIWFGSASEVQLRSAEPVEGVRIHFVAPADSSDRPGRADDQPGVVSAQPDAAAAALKLAAAALKLATPVLEAGPGQPEIIARSVWARGHATPVSPPFFGTVRLAFVHHTVNPNGYGPGQVPAMLRAIFDYHRFVRGYRDIAYNFIIDAFGRIWEARAGGIDAPVLGAHAGGFNAVSTGIAVLGTFMSAVPPRPALDALNRLLAWKLSLHGVPVLGRVAVRINPGDAFYTPFAPGQVVHLSRVSGHRDGDQTDCPGNAFYGRLPSLRPQIAALTGTPAKLAAAASTATVAPGATVTISGRLAMLNGGQPLAAAPIELQRVNGAGETTLATAATDAAGAWSLTVTVGRDMVLRALHRPAPAAVSELVAIGVLPVLTLALTSSSPPRVSGTIAPAKPFVVIDTYELLARGRRRLLASRRVAVRGGRFGARVPGLRPGRRLAVVARTAAGGGTLAGHSPTVTVY